MSFLLKQKKKKKTLGPFASAKKLGDVPRFGLGDGDDHTLEVGGEDHLTSEPGVLVENPRPGIPLEHVLFVVGARRELLEPFLSYADLALGRAGVDLLQPVRRRVDQAVVGQGSEEGVAGESHDLTLLAVQIDGEELHDAVRYFLGGQRRRRGRG